MRSFILFFYARNKLKCIYSLIAYAILISYSIKLEAEELRAHPHGIVFNAVEGHSFTETRSIFIFSAEGSSISWSQSRDASWITTSSQNGYTESVLRIGVNTTGMSDGVYHGNVTIQSAQSSVDPVVISVSLIINPDVPVKIATWKDGYRSAMSVSVDDGRASGFNELQSNGFQGTYVYIGTVPPDFYTSYYNAGMELGSHTVHHPSSSVSDNWLRYQEIEPNIAGICNYTPMPCEDVISFAWPYGYSNYREQAIASEYFLSARGYNFNQLEDPVPENFMNLRSFNSEEHQPYPPSDYKSVVDMAVSQGKWFNLVLHALSNDDGAINYAKTKNIWVTSIGNVIKYILQRERFIITNYSESSDRISYRVSRLAIPSSPIRSFENAFNSDDVVTLQVDINDEDIIESVLINGASVSYQTEELSGNKVLLVNVRLESSNSKSIVINYVSQAGINLTISGVRASNKVYDGTRTATLNTGSAVLVGVITGDDVRLISSGASGLFADKNAGTYKTVSTTGFTLDGSDASKYTLTQPSLRADIYAKELTIGGSFTAFNKVYDGNTTAEISTNNLILYTKEGNDNVNLIPEARFNNSAAGTAKTVSLEGSYISGTDASNYTLSMTEAPTTTASISQKTLTISGVTINSKVYDGTNVATLNTDNVVLGGVIEGDDVFLISSEATGAFTDKDAGTSRLVTTTGFSLTGTDAENYRLSQPTLYGDILRKALVVTAEDNRRPYGSENPVLTLSYSGFINHENASSLDVPPVVSTTALISSNVGIYPILLSGGTDNNYNLILVNGNLIIEKAPLTITAEDKTRYYGQANPPFTFIYSGFVLGQDYRVLDVLPVAATNADINSDAGIYDITVSGASDENYRFIYKKGILTINKLDQVLDFLEIPDGLRITEECQLNASATSGLPVSFETSDPDIGVVNGDILTITGSGRLRVTAKQEGNVNWNPATDVTRSIVTLPTFDNIMALFTPNNDGMNDYWHIPYLEQYGRLEVTVYNRFGQSVYRSDSYKNDWDGTFNGDPLPSASYYYIIKSSEKGIIRGVVNIVR